MKIALNSVKIEVLKNQMKIKSCTTKNASWSLKNGHNQTLHIIFLVWENGCYNLLCSKSKRSKHVARSPQITDTVAMPDMLEVVVVNRRPFNISEWTLIFDRNVYR